MIRTLLFMLFTFSFAACGGEPERSASVPAKSALPEKYVLTSAPSGATGVLAAKKEPNLGERVAVTGKVREFVDGRALLVITDLSLKSCDEEGPMSTCPTPWDYCCTDPQTIAAASATVEFRENGELLHTSARGFHGLDHLAKVTVVGKPERDAAGNLTLVAEGIYLAH